MGNSRQMWIGFFFACTLTFFTALLIVLDQVVILTTLLILSLAMTAALLTFGEKK